MVLAPIVVKHNGRNIVVGIAGEIEQNENGECLSQNPVFVNLKAYIQEIKDKLKSDYPCTVNVDETAQRPADGRKKIIRKNNWPTKKWWKRQKKNQQKPKNSA